MPDDELVYNDGTEVEVTLEPEDCPTGDDYVDSEDVIAERSEDEEAAGEFLGAAIDIDDDEDDGSKWGTVEEPTMRAEDFA
jgi:hypothetical protein